MLLSRGTGKRKKGKGNGKRGKRKIEKKKRHTTCAGPSFQWQQKNGNNANYWRDKVATFWRLMEIKFKVLVARFDASLSRIEGVFVVAFSAKVI